jgi:predicted amidohydrolase
VHYCGKRDEIFEKNLKRHLELIDFLVPYWGGVTGAPCKLVVFPEFGIHGIPQKADGSWNGVAIDVPGEETELCGKKAKELGIYIAFHAWTEYPDFAGRPFAVGVLIDPDGKIVLRHHKVVTSKTAEAGSTAPGDAYDWFVEKFGDGLDAFFPVADTELGKMGFIICGEGTYPEIARGLMMNGAEILLRPNAWIEPQMTEPTDIMAVASRYNAFANMCYLVESNWGYYYGPAWPKGVGPGRSEIVDYFGRILARASAPGETGTAAEINMQSLRRYREEMSFAARMVYIPSHIFRKVYDTEIWPKNTLMEKKTSNTFEEWQTLRRQVIESRRDIYTPSRK